MEIKEKGELGKERVEKINQYVEDLIKNRKWASLVSQGFGERSQEMINDSILIMEEIKRVKGRKVVDIGSGGGIVGITLGIVDKEMEVTLVERSKRKCAFLAEEIKKLELKNVRVKCNDAENLIGEEEYEISVSRGVGKIERVAGVGLALLRKGGIYITIKGQNAEKEVEEAEEIIKKNGGRIEKIERPVEGEEKERKRTAIVVIEKVM